MSDTIVSIDWSEVRAGKLGELRAAMKALVDFVDNNETRPLAYEVFFSSEGTRMTVLQVHPDSARWSTTCVWRARSSRRSRICSRCPR